jgi:hypothetical protein
MLNYDRFVHREELSDVAFFLMNMNDCPESVPTLERDDRISPKELAHINYVVHRNFRARVLDFQRMCYPELMKRVVLLLDPTTLMWSWSRLADRFYQLLKTKQLAAPAPAGASATAGAAPSPTAAASDQQDTDYPRTERAQLLKEAYQEVDARAKLEELIAQYGVIRKDLAEFEVLLQWYLRQVQKKRAALSDAMFKL